MPLSSPRPPTPSPSKMPHQLLVLVRLAPSPLPARVVHSPLQSSPSAHPPTSPVNSAHQTANLHFISPDPAFPRARSPESAPALGTPLLTTGRPLRTLPSSAHSEKAPTHLCVFFYHIPLTLPPYIARSCVHGTFALVKTTQSRSWTKATSYVKTKWRLQWQKSLSSSNSVLATLGSFISIGHSRTIGAYVRQFSTPPNPQSHQMHGTVFVLDLAPNGEMQARISRMGSLSLACARYYTAQIIDALDYMHSKDVIHRYAPVPLSINSPRSPSS